MRFLSFIILLVVGTTYVFPQSPHGENLRIDCANCHESTNWKTIPKNLKFDHNKETSFKLTGQHASVNCQSCHKSLVFSEVKSECISCHKDVHQNTLGPNCENCHITNTWIVSNIIQMHQNSRFPLVGVHLNIDCRSCHSGYENLLFPPQSVSCFNCHAKQYYATSAPNHVQSNFSTNCEDCHSITNFTWANTSFDHSFFPLLGGHNIANCFSCHTQSSNFKGLSTDCYSCHKQQYLQTTNPNHVQAKFSTACQDCHTINSFNDATFNHSTTGFALTGAHITVNCQSCHTSGYTNTSSDCYSCHSKDFAGTTDPNHSAAGLPQTCQDCHNTTDWTQSTFNHSSTGFSLTGAHVTLDCSSCHNGKVTGLTTDCYSCHSQDYTNTKNPLHNTQGFPHDCTQCHSTTNWSGATFDHSTTGFPLTGAHTSVSCQSCHTSGYTTALSTNCYDCHTSDFNNTNNPPHQSAGYPTDCTECHTTTAWSPSTFDHKPYFPLTGNHNVSCDRCHQTISNFAIHSCNASCHKNDHHQNEDCYNCHKTGSHH